jgi:hypothetical protein
VPVPIPTTQPVSAPLSLTTLKNQLDLLGGQLSQITADNHALNSITHVHTQSVPADTWTITHGFTDKFPSVTVIDSAGTEVIGDVQYVGTHQVVLTFAAEFSGKAYLN